MALVGDGTTAAVDVTIVMPCLDEALSLPACIANAKVALDAMARTFGLAGEILIADNGSTDGSQDLARSLGARVVPVRRRGYGAALIGGAGAARGRYIVMGDADGSYDFREAVAMVGRLIEGADLCMGSRFKGEIKPGAMPWKNRHIGNPVLTGILNLLFTTGVSDAHCGLRAFTKDCFARLRLTSTGMEFASEMVIKAALLGCRIAETPASLSPDLRDRPPHLRPWRDGWRHLRYLLILSPSWVFAFPAAFAGALGLAILVFASAMALFAPGLPTPIGNYWIVLAGALIGLGHTAGLLAAAGHLYGVREGYRPPSPRTARLARFVSLETMLFGGLGLLIAGLAVLVAVAAWWSAHQFGAIASVLPAVIGTSLVVVGAQNVLGGFLLAILGGNEAAFLREPEPDPQARPEAEIGYEVLHGLPR
ncbi:MAG: glycosyltransferase family 2 protein [Rhodoplanes sp.]|uniref:glycosyltransferase family 2 protein n=1 Tax=Rhodoplanes sp. TaxID=1968906 RepID=UPI00180FD729|nr:glycosyltransferase family 2 protein [Rhodoplanes sp.]NVO15184.1 glycosyltransferase family 2 protein [Rhodoplanes sp.]